MVVDRFEVASTPGLLPDVGSPREQSWWDNFPAPRVRNTLARPGRHLILLPHRPGQRFEPLALQLHHRMLSDPRWEVFPAKLPGNRSFRPPSPRASASVARSWIGSRSHRVTKPLQPP